MSILYTLSTYQIYVIVSCCQRAACGQVEHLQNDLTARLDILAMHSKKMLQLQQLQMGSASSARARWGGWASGTNETPGVDGLDVSERVSWGGWGGGRDTTVSEAVSNSFLGTLMLPQETVKAHANLEKGAQSVGEGRHEFQGSGDGAWPQSVAMSVRTG
jgi:hypothetical protein